MRRDLGVTLTLLAIATIIAILICIIGYCFLFSQNGIITVLANTKEMLVRSYEGEAQTLSKLEEYVDSFIPEKQEDKIYLSYIGE